MSNQVEIATPSPRYWRAARVITECSGPAVCAVAGLLIVALRNAGHGYGAVWGGVAAIFVGAIPMAYIIRGVKAGRWTDHHVDQRKTRSLPLLVAATSVATCTMLLIAVGAPRELIALVIAQLVGLIAVIGVTRWWKISIHAAVAGGLLGILIILFGSWALVGFPLIAVICWARTVLDAHTRAQAVTGAVLGLGIAVTVFSSLR